MGDRRAAARDSVQGLALGDAFGERWFPLFRTPEAAYAQIRARRMPSEAPWYWTDDTAMALGVLRTLHDRGEIEQDHLSRVLAETYLADPARGYGSGMHELLPRLAKAPTAWRSGAQGLFGGRGSLGNGAAMRTAPLGAWFHDDLDQVVVQAVRAAEVTHRHPEGIAGAVAVAVAAAAAAATRDRACPIGSGFLRTVAERTPPSLVRDGLEQAGDLPADTPAWKAADLLGNGQRIRADDTVPFALWSAAHHLDSLTDALWVTAEGLGDVDTTCAITAGIVAARTGLHHIPDNWLARREPLPDWVETDTEAEPGCAP
ncbi:ADP-ribosylglycohydrolase family protein [Peterkaempfera sp. SMS 1(5)a]|uniref:ADP-ribosylglycohydrolase family protein n=1 Tax=Peterkaempfera podocarpi TaxID=3232308 RepID=UPI00366AD8F9